MVRLPSRLVVRGRAPEPTPEGTRIRFDALVESGQLALRDGVIALAE
jgi:hypothetical protein